MQPSVEVVVVKSYFNPSSALTSSDWFPVSLDDKTAQKLLWISESSSKVARTSDAVCPYPNRPERYEDSPQVVNTDSDGYSGDYVYSL